MTKLIVTPIDMGAPGSFKARKRLLRALSTFSRASADGETNALIDALDTLEVLVCEYLETDDGTSVADALEMCSADDFDALVGGLINGQETIPNASSAS